MLLRIADHVNESEGYTFVGLTTLAREMGVTRRTATSLFAVLLKSTELKIELRPGRTSLLFILTGTILDGIPTLANLSRVSPSTLANASTYPNLKTKKGTKASVASATLAHTNPTGMEEPIKKKRSGAILRPNPTEKTATLRVRTKTTSVGSSSPTGTGEEVFCLFWDSFPPSWKKRGKDKVRAHFLRLNVGMDWFMKRWVSALRHVNYREEGRPREVKYLISPERFLVDRRWTDGY